MTIEKAMSSREDARDAMWDDENVMPMSMKAVTSI